MTIYLHILTEWHKIIHSMTDFDIDKKISLIGGEDPGAIIPIISETEEIEKKQNDFPEVIGLLPLRNMVLFPGVILPIAVGRKKSQQLVKKAYKEENYIGVVAQRDAKIDAPKAEDLFLTGTTAKIIKILEMPDNSITAILQGVARFDTVKLIDTNPFYQVEIVERELDDTLAEGENKAALEEAIKDIAEQVVESANNMPGESMFALRNIENFHFLINFISCHFPFKVDDKQNLLEIDNLGKRAHALMEILSSENQFQKIKRDIQHKASSDLNKQQREYFLNQQIKTIQSELGSNPAEQEIEEMKERSKTMNWSKEAEEMFEKEISKLERTNPSSPEFGVISNYLSTILDLPWETYSDDNFDIKNAEKTLDQDHFGLDKVKERIMEYLAVLKLKNDMKSPILCMVGPPGVGKTSLGKSIAAALGREYVRMSLGGLHDESEVRGHRKTYIGAMPGRIIQSIRKAGTSNPVFMLDEIDKVGSDHRGDPSSALLEVLDPEQNSTFHDNYLEIDYDLSKVLFIATANSLSTISGPLRDRMEIIDVSGYVQQEKVEIAKRHLIPKQLEAHGLKKSNVSIPIATIKDVIDGHTSESGVRTLDKKIASIMRKAAKKLAIDDENKQKVSPENLKDYLGFPRYSKEMYQGNDFAGVVTGLAWTAVGGVILYVEASCNKSKVSKLTLTGNLGDVMKESAILALEYIKSNATKLGLKAEDVEQQSVHIHVPQGAIPKDGPSAGITMATALVSALTGTKVKKNIAMTGEITLRGKVEPVGGIKEKILAAKRAGIKEIILCNENQKDVEEINEDYLKGLKFHFVGRIDEVFDIALTKQKAK